MASPLRAPLTRVQAALPAAWYRDPAHYERELDVFWYDRWVAVAREEEIPRAGDWRLVRIGTQSLVITKDEASLRAFHNTCRHRGSVLCTQDKGSFVRKRIVCPYHAWTYDLSGRLVATPRRMETPDFRAADYPLYEVAVDRWGGFVFVHFGGRDAPPLCRSLGDLQGRYVRHGFQDLRIGKRIVVDVQANWKLLAENFSECFHCPPVHPEFCRIVTAYQDAGAWGLRGQPEAKPEYKAGARTLTRDGTARLPPFPALNETETENLYAADMMLPNLFLNVHPDYVNSQIMFPTGPQSVRMVYDWLFEARHLPLPEPDLEHYVALWRITNRQDARNCEWQQEGMQSREFAHGVYVPQEFDAHRFAEWVRAGLSAQ